MLSKSASFVSSKGGRQSAAVLMLCESSSSDELSIAINYITQATHFLLAIAALEFAVACVAVDKRKLTLSSGKASNPAASCRLSMISLVRYQAYDLRLRTLDLLSVSESEQVYGGAI